MSIVDALKEMITELGGDASGVNTIQEAIVALTPLITALQGE